MIIDYIDLMIIDGHEGSRLTMMVMMMMMMIMMMIDGDGCS